MTQLVTLVSAKGDKLELDLHGAYITSLQSAAGQDVLFTRTQIGEKLRGGIPVCAPIFGPGDRVGLAQHGFARDIDWDVVEKTDHELTLRAQSTDAQRSALPSAYRALDMELHIELLPAQLMLSLKVTNEGNEPCVVTPAFHPYFPTQDATQVTVSCNATRQQFTTDQLAQTQFLSAAGKPVLVRLETLEVTLHSSELQRFAIWSGNADAYICVEPSAAGNLPADVQDTPRLNPGDSRLYAAQLSWLIPGNGTNPSVAGVQ